MSGARPQLGRAAVAAGVALRARTAINAAMKWQAVSTPEAVNLQFTLTNGQAFGWQEASSGVWRGVIGQHPLLLRQAGSTVEYAVSGGDAAPAAKRARTDAATDAADAVEAALRDFLQLDCPRLMSELCAAWAAADPRMATISGCLPGMRILRQDPFECLVSFICSSNNNIPRITQMLRKLRARYGVQLLDADNDAASSGASAAPAAGSASSSSTSAGEASSSASLEAAAAVAAAAAVGGAGVVPVDVEEDDDDGGDDDDDGGAGTGSATAGGSSSSGRTSAAASGTAPALPDGSLFAFPTPDALAAASEADLRALGLGYRAKFIHRTATMVRDKGGDAWLKSLRAMPRGQVQKELVALPGVGPKVADCVALFSLDQTGCIPVDTHVWTIACRHLDPTLTSAKSLTPAVYERVGDLFRARYGSHAGWAHSLLFAAELPSFRHLLPAAMTAEMAAQRAVEQQQKAEQREAAKARKAAKAAAAGAAAASSDASADGVGSAVAAGGESAAPAAKALGRPRKAATGEAAAAATVVTTIADAAGAGDVGSSAAVSGRKRPRKAT